LKAKKGIAILVKAISSAAKEKRNPRTGIQASRRQRPWHRGRKEPTNNGNQQQQKMDADDDDDDVPMDRNNDNNRGGGGGGNRLSDQVSDMDDEPALQGYERYVYSSNRRLEWIGLDDSDFDSTVLLVVVWICLFVWLPPLAVCSLVGWFFVVNV
jgi:hypothetical protein